MTFQEQHEHNNKLNFFCNLIVFIENQHCLKKTSFTYHSFIRRQIRNIVLIQLHQFNQLYCPAQFNTTIESKCTANLHLPTAIANLPRQCFFSQSQQSCLVFSRVAYWSRCTCPLIAAHFALHLHMCHNLSAYFVVFPAAIINTSTNKQTPTHRISLLGFLPDFRAN